jgi:hypothetical protein
MLSDYYPECNTQVITKKHKCLHATSTPNLSLLPVHHESTTAKAATESLWRLAAKIEIQTLKKNKYFVKSWRLGLLRTLFSLQLANWPIS